MYRTLATVAASLVVYLAITLPTVLTLNNLINKTQENRLNVQRADIDALEHRVTRLEKQ